MKPLKRKTVLMWGIISSLLVIAADQCLKLYIRSSLEVGEQRELIAGFVLKHLEKQMSSVNIFAAGFFMVCLILLILFVTKKKDFHPFMILLLADIGAVLSIFGESFARGRVTDFFTYQNFFYAVNLADVVLVSVWLILLFCGSVQGARRIGWFYRLVGAIGGMIVIPYVLS